MTKRGSMSYYLQVWLKNMESRPYTGLKPLALALMFVPDPVTTVLGVGLLGYVKYMKQQGEIIRRRVPGIIEGYYSYRIDMPNKSTITFQMSPTRQGQLPFPQRKTYNLCDTPQTRMELQKTGNRQTRAHPSRSSAPQPAGLLGKLQSRDSKFFAPRQKPTS